jgi:hypothetical protein
MEKDVVDSKGKTAKGKRHVPLESHAAVQPTPRTITGGVESAGRKKELRGKANGGDLQAATERWPTATSTDSRSSSGRNPDWGHRETLTDAARSFPQGQPTSTPGEPSSSATRRLNPCFVEWLMGWPIGWTDCDSPATEWSLYRQRMRSALLALALRGSK